MIYLQYYDLKQKSAHLADNICNSIFEGLIWQIIFAITYLETSNEIFVRALL